VRRTDGSITHRHFHDIPLLLDPGDLMVLNDSRVIPARLKGQRSNGGKAEILLLRRLEPGIWEALVKPSKGLPPGAKIRLLPLGSSDREPAFIEVLESDRPDVRKIAFADEDLLEDVGQTPLPPYIHGYSGDPERYQTVYARTNGSVAAPTAGLHFTPALLHSIEERRVGIALVTLHVGLDSFRPVREDDPKNHSIHKEYGELPPDTAAAVQAARSNGKRIVCVGTTTVRLLEQAALAGGDPPAAPFKGWVDLFILPGHDFRLADAMITNFHLPRSTLLMLVSAFAGKQLIERAYREAISLRYRFYSFGDAMLIL
jgi:S-adenosylmethionine:tRNA ribosyltransferase-isomerase